MNEATESISISSLRLSRYGRSLDKDGLAEDVHKLQRKRAEASGKTYKTVITSNGIPNKDLFLHLNLCDFFSSAPNFTIWKSSLGTTPFCLLRIDMRNRFQKPGLRCGPRYSNSRLTSSPSFNVRNDELECALFCEGW